ncbi:hypothetical protein MTO96_037933 [Rhipicephalus appendiculatus]
MRRPYTAVGGALSTSKSQAAWMAHRHPRLDSRRRSHRTPPNRPASACRRQGVFNEPTSVLDDGSSDDLEVIYESNPKGLNENCDFSHAQHEASSVFACAAAAVKAAGIIIQNALEQDSVMRRERHKLQMDVLQLKKAKLKLALERRMRT